MGLKRLREFLRRHNRVALDTSIFIYQIEANDRYLEMTDVIFAWLERPESEGIASTITMLEVLVRPYREGDLQRVNEFDALLSTYPNLRWVDVNLDVADLGAQIRGEFGLRTPDALQAACAIYGNATGLVTNDKVFLRVPGLEVLVLEELL